MMGRRCRPYTTEQFWRDYAKLSYSNQLLIDVLIPLLKLQEWAERGGRTRRGTQRRRAG